MSTSPVEAGPTGLFGTMAAPASATAAKSPSADKDMFLQLLVAQMRYQDPSNPMDSTQFLAQTAQFTTVEKLDAVADLASQLLSSQMAFGASSLVGRHVTWADPTGTTGEGTVDGVTYGADGPLLSIGSDSVPLGQVQSVTAG